MNLTGTVEMIRALTGGQSTDESVNERAEGGARLAHPYLLTMAAPTQARFLEKHPEPLLRCFRARWNFEARP
jgi:hypothetical protein